MQKSVVVNYKLYDTETYAKIAVSYEIETDEKRVIYKCLVNLTGDRIPEWLTVTAFEIPTVHEAGSPGVNITSFSEVKGIRNVDTAFFIQQVYQSIFVKEASE
jgi:hypothetical protein